MFFARAGFGTFSNIAGAVVTPSNVVKRVTWLVGVLAAFCFVSTAQSLNINVTEFSVPTPNSIPLGITNGPDGALWFTENAPNVNKVGRITTAGMVTEYSVPLAFPGAGGSPGPLFIAAGPDGALWFTQYGGIGRITTAGAVTTFAGHFPTKIATGPDGAVWFTEEANTIAGSFTARSAIGRITPAGAITTYQTPSPCSSSDLGGITLGPDGAMWFTSLCAKSIGRIAMDGTINEYSVPDLQTPGDIAAGPDGALWFTNANSVGRMTTTGILTEYPVGFYIAGITRGPDNAMWLTSENLSSQITRISTTGVVTRYNIPDFAYRITLGPDAALWYTANFDDKIVRLQVPARTGVLSHIAAGGGWNTVITLVNNSAAAVPVTLALHNDDGSALTLPVTTTQQGASQPTTASSVSATINPNATLLISTGDQVASTVVGWADVTSVGPLGGYAIFRQTPQTGSPSEGTVPLQSQFPSTVTLAYDNTAGFVMGVALANLSTSSANITATMWDDSGNLLGTQIITIAGSGHTAFVLPTQLALTAGKRGIVKFQATGGITGLGLRFSPFGTFTSVPTM